MENSQLRNNIEMRYKKKVYAIADAKNDALLTYLEIRAQYEKKELYFADFLADFFDFDSLLTELKMTEKIVFEYNKYFVFFPA